MYARPELARGGIHSQSIDTYSLAPNIGGLGSTAWAPTANTAIYHPILVHTPVVIASLWVGASATTVAGNYDLGLYDAAGTALERRGSTAHPGVSDEAVYTLATPRLLLPGLYYIGFVADVSTATYVGQLFAVPSLMGWGLRSEASAFPLPATATWTTTPFNCMVACGVFLNTIAT